MSNHSLICLNSGAPNLASTACWPASAAYNEPNEETLAAMKEAASGVELETLDVDNFRSFVKSL